MGPGRVGEAFQCIGQMISGMFDVPPDSQLANPRAEPRTIPLSGGAPPSNDIGVQPLVKSFPPILAQ